LTSPKDKAMLLKLSMTAIMRPLSCWLEATKMRVTFLELAAVGLTVAGAAQAADLPARKAAPVDYVRICSLYGPGFFYIPGSDTCIRIGGRAVFEYVNGHTFNRVSDGSNFNATGRIFVDARTATDWGLLRAFIRMDFNRNSGNDPLGSFGSGTGLRAGTRIANQLPAGAFPGFSGVDTAGARLETGVNVSSAFVQWGGLTAGRLQSFFDFYVDRDTWFTITDSDVVTQALAYTYTFGSGFSATLSIEDPKERQRYPVAGIAAVAAGGINPVALTPGFNTVYPFAFSPFAAPAILAGGTINYTQRESIPDVVGVLRLDQGWGSAQLSGAYHRIATEGSTVVNFTPTNTGVLGAVVVNPLVPTVAGGYGAKTGNGGAVQGGVKINLPMLAAGDTIYLQAAYSKGNLSYVDSGYPAMFTGTGDSFGGTTFSTYDAVVGPNGRMTLTPAYSALVSLEHYWTPTIRQGLFVGGEWVRYSNAIRTAAGFAAGSACPTCLGTATVIPAALNGGVAVLYNPFSPNYDGGVQYNMGTNLIWSPVKDLDIGAEAFYYRNQMQHRQFDVNTGTGQLTREYDAWRFRLRVLRDF
jgi:hypothetical protein